MTNLNQFRKLLQFHRNLKRDLPVTNNKLVKAKQELNSIEKQRQKLRAERAEKKGFVSGGKALRQSATRKKDIIKNILNTPLEIQKKNAIYNLEIPYEEIPNLLKRKGIKNYKLIQYA